MIKVINVVGARPNFMKIAPIQREMSKYSNIKPVLVHTGQHYDKRMSKFFFNDLQLPEPDIYLGVGSGTHAEQTAKIMTHFEKILNEEKPDLVLVVGDVNSTAACSLVAAKMNTKIAHVEAGLRSFDRTMPEEINRLVTDVLSDLLFVTEKSGLENLKREGIADHKVHFVGHVMIDSLIYFKPKADQSAILDELNLTPGEYGVITLHRPSNVDNKQNFEKLLNAFAQIEQRLPLIFPIHPRSQKMIDQFGLREKVEKMSNLRLLDPLGYLDFMKLLHNAKLVLTDSGGIQEETTFLGIPCITMRENTERPITVEIGTNVLVGTDTQRIVLEAEKILDGNAKKGQIPELWDGHAAERIVKIINEELS
ncbi:UDP-N-acetylglucosamine 2-epimerase [Caldithrix abyssi DSM 13497]|uniref:UDP-N-acetylglucosamine 2-epimerase n=1 Tax=Caldithrix abyssi DSM 13497 TaxID=880073 RepID=H1XS93_CALAY|nr:UDP-N-acetylglucosamine 2-epimerase (non-hydrolyzing) [Caldithrix abyssi]APF20199.1 UDP-N-acetylglucosamine 2-epimerase (non-hydrolysing) [Caldithrix abyssi DSM 13497]EHO40257.1 UDP-N-acetylglucosamine 2-epimerase [Caldithrix abyssi DSM 13497]